jgi:hypothetical protein
MSITGTAYNPGPYEDDDFEKQNTWMTEYRLDPIRLGRMCEQYPALQKSWEQFKTVYDLVRSQDDIDRQIPPHLR